MTTDSTKPLVAVPLKPEAPLSNDLRADLINLLAEQGKIYKLQNTLTAKCSSEGWQGRVEERIVQALNDEEVKNYRDLQKLIMEEVLGRPISVEEPSNELNGTKTEMPGGSSKIQMPAIAVDAGVELLRDAFVGNVDVKETFQESAPGEKVEWNDWR